MKIRFYFFALLFIAGITKNNAQNFEWASKFTSDGDDQSNSIFADANGNVYTTGSFFTNQDFDGGPGTYTLNPLGYEDVYITKHDSDGHLIWAKSVGGNGHDIGYAIKADASGNVYVTGVYGFNASGVTYDFDPGAAVYPLNTSNSGYASFILKLDANGDFVWAKELAGIYGTYVYSLNLSNLGEIYVTGFFTGTVDFDPGTPVYNLTTSSTSNYDAYILKLDNAGNFMWAKDFGGNKDTRGKSITIATNGDVYLTGDFMGVTDFDPNVGIVNLTSQNTLNPDCFIIRLNSAGNLKWVKQVGGSSGSAYGYGISLSQTGKLYISGVFSGPSVDFDPGASIVNATSGVTKGIFILKLDTIGNFKWVKNVGGLNSNNVSASANCLDSDENIYTTGYFENTMDFNPSSGINNLVTASNGRDGFILKLDSIGNFNWVNQISGDITTTYYSREGTSICTGPNNKILLTGYFIGKTDFNSSPAPQDTFYLYSGNFFGTYYKDSYIYSAFQDKCSGFTLLVNNSTNVSCNVSGIANASYLNGTAPITYLWNTVPTSTISSAVFNGYGIYSLTIRDSNLCTRSTSLLINAPTTSTGFDLDANLLSSSFRPGFSADLWVDAYNGGCTPKTGQLKIILNNLFNYSTATNPPDLISGDTLIWDFNLLNYDSTHIVSHIFGTTAVSAQIGSSMCFTTMITPTTGDSYPNNNLKTYCYPIINGYDPNIKSVYPSGECSDKYVLNNQKLSYSVKFQNTGNSNAININILDSLDTHLNLNTLKVIGNSHPVITEILPGNIIKFRFNNIMLPDSLSNEALSHGYVIYEITPLLSLPENTSIKNRANIYFDFNAPVNTNQVQNKLVSVIPNCNVTVNVKENQKKTIDIYPNPSSDYFIIDNVAANAFIKIYDITGKLVVTERTNTTNCIINTTNLQNGIFLVDITEGNERTTTRIIVRR